MSVSVSLSMLRREYTCCGMLPPIFWDYGTPLQLHVLVLLEDLKNLKCTSQFCASDRSAAQFKAIHPQPDTKPRHSHLFLLEQEVLYQTDVTSHIACSVCDHPEVEVSPVFSIFFLSQCI